MKTKKQNIDGFYQKLDEILKQATKRLKTVQEIPVKVLLSEDNTAKVLGFSKQTLARWRIQGKGPQYHDLEGSIRYDYFELVDFINNHKRRSTSQVVKRENLE